MRRDLALALALVGALVIAYVFGRCAQKRGAELSAWKDSTAVAHVQSKRAVEAFQREERITQAALVHLDSARRELLRAVAKEEAKEEARPVLGLGAATLAPLPATVPRNPLILPALELERSCTAYQSQCERLQAAATAAIDSLEHENDLLRRRPADPAERLFQPFGSIGYDPYSRVGSLRAGGELRLWRDWRLAADVERRLVAGDTARFNVWLTRRF